MNQITSPLLGADRLNEICRVALDSTGGVPAEVWIVRLNEALTRFANNAIHQNTAEDNLTLTLRVNRDGRSGLATTNRLDAEGLRQAAQTALEFARVCPQDSNDPGLALPQNIQPARAFDEAAALCPPAQRAGAVLAVCRAAEAAGLNASGAYSTTAIEQAAANSNGVFVYHPYTRVEYQFTPMGETSSGRAQAVDWKLAGLDIPALSHAAIQGALDGANPIPFPPGEYAVVLSPLAVLDMVFALVSHGANGMAVEEGRSWMNDRQGKKVVSPLISLYDDALDPGGIPLPFDGEGQPRRRVEIIRRGVIGSPVYDRATAFRTGHDSTGHTLPPASRSSGALPANLFLSAGGESPAQLIAGMERGLYITRFWYTRLVHARDCVMTGMTRDGVFWVEDGRIVRPVRNLRFTQSYLQALAGVQALSQETALLKAQYGEVYARVPALRLKRFRFTASS